ncbi:helix-turn-helix domain-containing protein [Symbiopectobacterium purcellii]|uniref:Helix-turn-helix domain-containing protein n=1 Tax=Symbiopectobacterium purcellii TaxID=2871826 RepID=A0ABX9AQX5_9ENTR|nr:helix-turn-helix domain-containing protein [Symbiopectobacterium purcellii]QZN96441.1 helix-turn-helix domain-containing protein [Symbiopectobacterium purcellii]
MSMLLMAKAMSIKVGNPLRKLVLLKLADNANYKGEAWPSIPHIAQQCEMAERTVQGHVQSLQKSGFLWIEKRKGSNGINQSNIYHLTLEKGEKESLKSGACPASSDGATATPHGESPAPHGANAAPGDGASAAPRISHSFEPVMEPKPPLPPTGGDEGSSLQSQKTKTAPPDYQAVLQAYNDAAGNRLPNASTLNDARRRAIKRLLSELAEPTPEAAGKYFQYFMETAKPFYFGENPRQWQANFDYLLRSDTLLKTREGAL